jgi:hypothetical protein
MGSPSVVLTDTALTIIGVEFNSATEIYTRAFTSGEHEEEWKSPKARLVCTAIDATQQWVLLTSL